MTWWLTSLSTRRELNQTISPPSTRIEDNDQVNLLLILLLALARKLLIIVFRPDLYCTSVALKINFYYSLWGNIHANKLYLFILHLLNQAGIDFCLQATNYQSGSTQCNKHGGQWNFQTMQSHKYARQQASKLNLSLFIRLLLSLLLNPCAIFRVWLYGMENHFLCKGGIMKNAAKLSRSNGPSVYACMCVHVHVPVVDASISAQNCLMAPSSCGNSSALGIQRIRVCGMETCITVHTYPATTVFLSRSSMCLLVVESHCGASLPAAGRENITFTLVTFGGCHDCMKHVCSWFLQSF